MSKRCGACKENKEIDYFYRNKSKSDGRHDWCKACSNKTAQARHKRWKASHSGREWHKNFNVKRVAKYNTPAGRYKHFDWDLRRKYGIGVWEWAHMFNEQNGRCAGCQAKLLFDGSTVVDHCHKTVKVRGLLCNNCNLALGYIKDDVEILKGLVKYLANYVD